jgi:hypothetical protein
VDELLDELLATLVIAATATPVVPTPSATAAIAITATASSASTRRALFLGRSLGNSFGVRFVGLVLLHHLKLQSAFAGSVGEGLHPAMEQEAAAVEYDLAHAGSLGALCDSLANGSSTVLGRTGLSLQVLVDADATVLPAASSMTCA